MKIKLKNTENVKRLTLQNGYLAFVNIYVYPKHFKFLIFLSGIVWVTSATGTKRWRHSAPGTAPRHPGTASGTRHEAMTGADCRLPPRYGRELKLEPIVCFNNRCRSFNPRLTGGGAFDDAPPSRIFAIAQKRTELSTWNLAGLLIQQFAIVREILFEIRRKFFEIWSILWRHYTPLLVENWPNFAGLWKTQFLMKTQMENTKRRKMRSSTWWLSRFFKSLGFWPLK